MTVRRPRRARPPTAWALLAIALLAVALLARTGFVLATPAYTPHLDDRDYLNLGGWIARTGAYPTPQVWVTSRACPPIPGLTPTRCVTKPGAAGARLVARPTAYRPPAYPYALAAPELLARWFGADALSLARAFQVLLGVLDAALIGLLAKMLWGRRVGLVALGLAAVYVPLVLVSGTLISEPLYVALMLGAVCAVLHRRAHRDRDRNRNRDRLMLPLAGALAGLCALTRSNGVIVVLAVAALAVAVDHHGHGIRRLRGAAVILAFAVLTVTPWMVRDAVVLGHLTAISTESGGTLVGTYNATSRADRSEPATWLGLSHIGGDHTLYREQAAYPETAIDAVLRDDAFDFAVAHPTYIASVLWHNTLRLLDLDGFDRVRFTAGSIDLPRTPAVVGAIMFYAVALLALAGAVSPAARRAPRMLWLLPTLQFATTVLVISETPRFRTPLDPFILLLAALTVERVGAMVARRTATVSAPATPGAGETPAHARA